MGDIIVKTPMLEALSKLNSDLKIDIEVIKGGESLVENIPHINEVIIGDSYTKKNRISRIIIGPHRLEKFKDYFDKSRINIVVNHRASTEKRSFNYDELKEILIKLSKVDSKVSVYLATMPNEYKTLKNIVDKLKIKNVQLLMKTDTVGEFAGIIKYCDIVVSVDTGVIHIASVYDKPIVGVYPLSENSYKLFAPRSSKYEIVRGKKDGYTIDGFSIDGFSIDEIIEKTRKIIREKSEV